MSERRHEDRRLGLDDGDAVVQPAGRVTPFPVSQIRLDAFEQASRGERIAVFQRNGRRGDSGAGGVCDGGDRLPVGKVPRLERLARLPCRNHRGCDHRDERNGSAGDDRAVARANLRNWYSVDAGRATMASSRRCRPMSAESSAADW